jgi:general nucleoside transport system permease protein
MMASPIFGILSSTLMSSVSLIYAGLGELMSERAGIVNLGVEGLMLVGASVGFAVASLTGDPYAGIGAGGIAATLANSIFAFVVIGRRANQLASGLTLMFFGIGLSALIGKPFVGDIVQGLPRASVAGLSFDILAFLALPVAGLLWWLLFCTRWGLSLRATGENPGVAFASGKRPEILQLQGVLIGGFLAGIGGSHLSVGLTRTWAEEMTAGRGFMAIALVIFAKWNPLLLVPAAIAFGAAEAIQLQLQAAGADVSPFLLNMVPYLLTLAILGFWGWRRQSAAPGGLGRTFLGVE